MCKSRIHGLLQSLPKVEHHVHIEGTLEPDLLFSLAAKNNVPLPSNPAYISSEALLARYARFKDLADFLGVYTLHMSVLVTSHDFETLAWRYFERVAAQRVRHAEVFFDPQAHAARGVSYDTVIAGLLAAKRRAEQYLDLSVEYIICILGDFPHAEAHALVDSITERQHLVNGTLAGFGMVSSEKDDLPGQFADVFARVATSAPGKLTVHAGEEAGPEYIRSCLMHLGVSRIDHGRTAAQDPSLLQDLAARRILLTLCPVSNVALRAVPAVTDCPIRALLDAGVPLSLNSDDPAYFGAYIQDVYCAVQEAFDLSVEEWQHIITNGVLGSWCSEERKETILRELTTALQSFESREG
jgi:adenosine deaminase